MKNLTFRLLPLFLVAAFLMPQQVAFASAAATQTEENAQLLVEKMKQTDSKAFTGAIAEKQEKKGFFSKVKAFGKKAKAALKVMAGGGDHNIVVAILLAWFLGGIGIHRVYLGSKPIIVLWYILTLFGLFGLIPLIDFIRLILGHMEHYEGNNKLFAAFG